MTASSITGEGVEKLWQEIENFKKKMLENNFFHERRNKQMVDWSLSIAEDFLINSLYNTPAIKEELPSLKKMISDGGLTSAEGAKKLLNLFKTNIDDIFLKLENSL
jgi:LAO/AO transport system kinase